MGSLVNWTWLRKDSKCESFQIIKTEKEMTGKRKQNKIFKNCEATRKSVNTHVMRKQEGKERGKGKGEILEGIVIESLPSS